MGVSNVNVCAVTNFSHTFSAWNSPFGRFDSTTDKSMYYSILKGARAGKKVLCQDARPIRGL